MSSSSNISMRQRFIRCTRLSDSVIVLVNLNFVRTVEPTVGGVRLSFGNAASDHIDIGGVTLDQISTRLDP